MDPHSFSKLDPNPHEVNYGSEILSTKHELPSSFCVDANQVYNPPRELQVSNKFVKLKVYMA
jgi:hypothetical protein